MQSSSSADKNTQGRSNQQGTSGKGGLKDFQGKLMQYGSTAADKFSHMTTKQKAMVGGAVLALGAGWMALSQRNKNKIKSELGSAASTVKNQMQSKQNNPSSSNSSKSNSGSSRIDARVK